MNILKTLGAIGKFLLTIAAFFCNPALEAKLEMEREIKGGGLKCPNCHGINLRVEIVPCDPTPVGFYNLTGRLASEACVQMARASCLDCGAKI